MGKNVTIYDVAREAGVSLATVSRVINGSNVVKPNTRERVMEAIQRLDFKPNQIARGLATSKTTTIAIVFPQSLFAHVKDMIGGIGDTSRRLDYNVSIYTTDEIGDGNPIETVIEKVVKSRADGVILFNNENIDEISLFSIAKTKNKYCNSLRLDNGSTLFIGFPTPLIPPLDKCNSCKEVNLDNGDKSYKFLKSLIYNVFKFFNPDKKSILLSFVIVDRIKTSK